MVKKISIVSPIFNEEQSLEECYRTIKSLFDGPHGPLSGYQREHIFCDNGSKDKTPEMLRLLAAQDQDVKVIFNSRNFGILRNTYNGVMASTGDGVVLFMPVDLQDPPELIADFVKLWESGYEVVFGIRAHRQEGFLMKSLRKIYYRIISRFSYVEYPADVGDFQFVDRKVIEAMKKFEDVNPFMRMLTFECGFKSVGVPYTWRRRKHGFSRNQISQLIDQGLLGLISFSSVPLRLALYSGFGVAVLSFLYALYVIGVKVFFPEIADRGVPTIIIAVFFFGGMNLLFLGLVGEYILAIFNQVRKRPLVIERERINF
jgi:glycosyltransferase involved in cell wall biosynthesis